MRVNPRSASAKPLAEPASDWVDVTPTIECSTAEKERALFQRAREKADAARARPEVGREAAEPGSEVRIDPTAGGQRDDRGGAR